MVASYDEVGSLVRAALTLNWKRIETIAGVIFMVGTLGACGTLFEKPAPSAFYQLAFSPQSVACASSLPASVRVSSLDAVPPYDQESMVVLANGGRVRYSSQYLWVAQPGKMVADWLVRDLSRTQVFPSVMVSGETVADRYDLGGRLFAFAWQSEHDRWQAVLDAEITLVANPPGQSRQILLRKAYRMVSEPVAEHGPEAFVQGMSKVMGQFSAALQRDLCAVAESLTSSPVAGDKP